MEKLIKKIPTLLIALLLFSNAAMSQRKNGQHSLQSNIENVLAGLPAENEKEFRARMNELASFGENGLVRMIEMLSPPNEGNNSKLEYALGGFAYYVSQTAREDLRQMTVSAFCHALKKVSNDENKAFLIRQFEMVGKNDAVPCLQVYLNDERFCAPAAKALINIGTPEASESLLTALRSSNGFCQLSMVKALGDLKYRKALNVISPLANEKSAKLRKLALYALANIADPASQDVLATAAEEEDFTYGKGNATAAYLLYARRLLENGQQREAENIAKSLLERNEDHQVHTRTAALNLLTKIQGEKSIDLLIDAAGSKNSAYRAAAMKFAADYITPAITEKWVRKSTESNPEVQAEIIDMLGRNNAKDALAMVHEALKSYNDQVRLSAIGTVGRIGDENSTPELLQIMEKAGNEEILAIKKAFLILDAEGLTDKVADALPKMQPEGKAALLEVLGNRAASHRVDDVFPYTANENELVRTAALSALKRMVTKEDLPRLFSLLREISNPEEISMVQEAVISALPKEENQSQLTATVLNEMERVQEDKRLSYFPILANIGGEKAKDIVSAAFQSGNKATKEAALQALAFWSDQSAINELYRISRENANTEYQDPAIKGYISTIGRSEYPSEKKLELLKQAMEVAKTNEQKQQILREVGTGKTFSELIFAGKYLDDPDLQQRSASAVMNIALNNDLQGEEVQKLLKKTLEVMEGPGSEYQKPAISRYLAKISSAEGQGGLSD